MRGPIFLFPFNIRKNRPREDQCLCCSHRVCIVGMIMSDFFPEWDWDNQDFSLALKLRSVALSTLGVVSGNFAAGIRCKKSQTTQEGHCPVVSPNHLSNVGRAFFLLDPNFCSECPLRLFSLLPCSKSTFQKTFLLIDKSLSKVFCRQNFSQVKFK